MTFIKKVGREFERGGKRIVRGVQDFRESELNPFIGNPLLSEKASQELGRFVKSDVGIATITAGSAAIPGVGPFVAPLVGGALLANRQKSDLAREARDQARAQAAFDAQATTGAAAAATAPTLPEIVQPTPLPGPGEVSVQLGTGQERARRRRARGRRQGRVFGGAGLLVPEADIRRQTLGGF